MKKNLLIIFALTVTTLVSCGGKTKQDSEVKEAPIQATEVYEVPENDEHNARNSLDYIGKYKGILSQEEVTIVLSDSTYAFSVAKKEDITGKYIWDKTGSIVTLEGTDLLNKYKVVENALIALDKDGQSMVSEDEDATVGKLIKVE